MTNMPEAKLLRGRDLLRDGGHGYDYDCWHEEHAHADGFRPEIMKTNTEAAQRMLDDLRPLSA